MANDYIPQSDGAFLEWAKPLVTYAAAHVAAFNVPQGALTPIQTQLAAYETAFEAAQNPNRGKVDVLNKNEARDALKTSLRTFVKAYLSYNPAVTDADKENMGLPLHDGTRTPTPPPSTIPEAKIDSSIIRQLTIHFKDNGSEKRGKPSGVHGVEIVWSITDSVPATMDEFKNSVFDTASPYTFTFDESQRGKKIFFCLRWENAKGDKGPWGEIYNAIIP
jgi:hypothetical protein